MKSVPHVRNRSCAPVFSNWKRTFWYPSSTTCCFRRRASARCRAKNSRLRLTSGKVTVGTIADNHKGDLGDEKCGNDSLRTAGIGVGFLGNGYKAGPEIPYGLPASATLAGANRRSRARAVERLQPVAVEIAIRSGARGRTARASEHDASSDPVKATKCQAWWARAAHSC